MAGNSDSAKRGNVTRAEQAKTRDKGTGGGTKPAFGTGAWARERGLWKEGDTEGPAPKTDNPKTS